MASPVEHLRPAPTTVFVLDDHEIVRRGLSDLLAATDDLVVVGEASTAAEARRRIPAVRPDVALLDARLPDGSGIEVCRQIRSDLPSVRCLIFTSYDDDEALLAAVVAGAAGYLLKQIRGSSILDSIRAAAAGRSLLDHDAVDRLRRQVHTPAVTDPRISSLTSREREILDLITDGCSNREIAHRLFLAEKTVRNYVSALLDKLEMQRRTQVAVLGAELRHQGEQPGPASA